MARNNTAYWQTAGLGQSFAKQPSSKSARHSQMPSPHRLAHSLGQWLRMSLGLLQMPLPHVQSLGQLRNVSPASQTPLLLHTGQSCGQLELFSPASQTPLPQWQSLGQLKKVS